MVASEPSNGIGLLGWRDYLIAEKWEARNSDGEGLGGLGNVLFRQRCVDRGALGSRFAGEDM